MTSIKSMDRVALPSMAKATVIAALLAFGGSTFAAVTVEEAAKLKSELTPLGAEKAGNKDGTIPAWTGGLTSPTPGFKNGGRRPDPFADEKPIAQITAKNMDQYADKLTDGTKILLKKYPASYRLDVYPTHRTAAAPQWMYNNTFKNATRATVEETSSGPIIKDAYGGIPFPIPKTGSEVMLNTQVRWRSEAWNNKSTAYQVTAGGQSVLLSSVSVDNLAPYYAKDGSAKTFNGGYWFVRVSTLGPAIRAGEALLGTQYLDESKTASWVYLTGQRRVRKLPNPCCDTPHPVSAGIMTFDEIETFLGRQDRFDWKLVGKKEIYIPYNSNRIMVPTKDSDILGTRHLNPDYVRWELHRVWVVEATLKPGQRHTSVKSRYYVDEDTWWPVLADRWDANGQLWRMPYSIPVAMPDIPAVVGTVWGAYDLLGGGYVAEELMNTSKEQYKLLLPAPGDAHFSPDALTGDGGR